ncbi:MAG: virulence factor Mce family protein [Frankiales bacterium]|nr:virulence factor Mce family protein [Frankiales bacterium]
MKLHFSAASLPRWRLGTVVVFTLLSLAMFLFLWVNSGGHLPGVGNTYRVAVQVPNAQNLVANSDVTVAGVKIGKVESIKTVNGVARAVLGLDHEVVPLHEGATVALRSKTLIEETYLDISDGSGKAMASDAVLPVTATKPAAHLDDVLNSLDKPTLTALGQLVRSGDDATQGRSADIAATLSALGVLGRDGHDVLDALAAQGEDLKTLSRSTTRVLSALDTNQGDISTLVTAASGNMRAGAAQKDAIAATVTRLPGTLRSARAATTDLRVLSRDLAPVARNLKVAAPGLRSTVAELPEATRQLEATIPSLNTLLDRAPATLTRVPAFSSATSGLVPPARQVMADLNPMLGYLEPYGPEISAFFTTIGGAVNPVDGNGGYIRVNAIFQPQSVTGLPVATNGLTPGTGANPYPAPGENRAPKPVFTGTYTRVTRDVP